MMVTVMTATENPIDVISLAAGTSYNKENTSLKRVQTCVRHRHTSVLEHATITFKVEGISRACSHQLVRHRLVSFVQQSQRYCKYDLTKSSDWYVVPDEIKNGSRHALAAYEDAMRTSASAYDRLLKFGLKPEDARYVLPEAMKTNVTMTMNARELFALLNLRLSPKAQNEIRKLAKEMHDKAAAHSDQWGQLMELYDDTQDIVM